MVNVDDIRAFIDSHHEWLLVREEGKTFPLNRTEIEITPADDRTLFGFLDDDGFHAWRLNEISLEDNAITVDVAGAFARKRERMRLVPRHSAAEFVAEIELARLKKANEIAQLITDNFTDTKLVRVALNIENGRLAQIIFLKKPKQQIAAIANVSQNLVPESILTAAILWLEKLGLRKKNPIFDIWIIAEKRQAKNLQKLHALLTDRWKSKISIVAISRSVEQPFLNELPTRKIRELWREKSKKLTLPANPAPWDTTRKIIDLDPERIDVIFSKQGETLRFMGLPFVRVRSVLGKQKAWFGIDRKRQLLTEESWSDLLDLIRELEAYRKHNTPNPRHELYRIAPEAWLESILRRNIHLLDANLILSPIYNQFRSSNDKIDLLALRKDGRLVIIELKASPDREMVFQAADYWRKIELRRRRGDLVEADLFDGREILDKPALIYLAAPAWSFHRDFEFFARTLSPEIELWRFELHENWREKVKVLARHNYSDSVGITNR